MQCPAFISTCNYDFFLPVLDRAHGAGLYSLGQQSRSSATFVAFVVPLQLGGTGNKASTKSHQRCMSASAGVRHNKMG